MSMPTHSPPTPDQIDAYNARLNEQVAAAMSGALAAKDGKACLDWLILAGRKIQIEEHLGEVAPLAETAIMMVARIALSKGTSLDDVVACFESALEWSKRWLVGEEETPT